MVLLLQGLPANYIIKQFGNNVDLVCYVWPGDNPDTQWKICLTQDSLIPTIHWFHQVLNHPGQARLFAALNQRYYHVQMRHFVTHFNCDTFQRYKLDGAGYGHLAE